MNKKLILVADDDPAIVESLQMILEFADYKVETTVDGVVISMAKQCKPDLLILDIWMSGVDGRDICKQWKLDSELKNIPVLMISASRDIGESTKEAGADEFIAKPFDMDNILKKIEEHLDKRP